MRKKVIVEAEKAYNDALAELIREERIKAKLTQKQLALKIGHTQSASIVKYETGKATPTAYVLHRIGKALNIDITL